MRDDLKLAAYALSLGYAIQMPEGFDDSTGLPGRPGATLKYVRGNVHVWETAKGWRVGVLRGGLFTPPEDRDFYRRLLPALKDGAALAQPLGFMTRDDALALKEGQAVRMLVETMGEDHAGAERTYPAGTVAVVGSAPQIGTRDGVTIIIGPPARSIVNLFEAGDYPGDGYPFAVGTLETLIAVARGHDDAMCDPHNDGSGDDARAPEGSDYTDLLDLIEAAATSLQQEG